MNIIIKESNIFFSEYLNDVKKYLTASLLCQIAELEPITLNPIRITTNNTELICFRNSFIYTVKIEKYSNYNLSLELNINPAYNVITDIYISVKSFTIYFSESSNKFIISSVRLNRSTKTPFPVRYISNATINQISKECELKSNNLYILIFKYLEKYNELETFLEKLTKQRKVKNRKK